MRIKVTVKFCKDIFITTSVESNSKKKKKFQFRCCTICPTFGGISVKNITYSFVNLRIMWVANLGEFFVGCVGA